MKYASRPSHEPDLDRINALGKFASTSGGQLSKRLFDVLVALMGLILLLPAFLIIAVYIWHDSKGPIFYRGKRVGRFGQVFDILKFRTMWEDAGSYTGSCLTVQDDPRITRVGSWLRSTKLNELPQLWNVLKGEMSLVGPRPEDPQLSEKWPEDVKREILSVRPGVTSPASVLYCNEELLLNSDHPMETYFEVILPDKLRLDLRYVRHSSFTLDLDILLWTLGILFTRSEALVNLSEEKLFAGPFTSLFRQRPGGWKWMRISGKAKQSW